MSLTVLKVTKRIAAVIGLTVLAVGATAVLENGYCP